MWEEECVSILTYYARRMRGGCQPTTGTCASLGSTLRLESSGCGEPLHGGPGGDEDVKGDSLETAIRDSVIEYLDEDVTYRPVYFEAMQWCSLGGLEKLEKGERLTSNPLYPFTAPHKWRRVDFYGGERVHAFTALAVFQRASSESHNLSARC